MTSIPVAALNARGLFLPRAALALATAVTAMAAAAPQAPAASPAASPGAVTPAQLAALAFPGWSDSAAGRLQTVTLARMPGAARNPSRVHWSAGPNRVLVEPRLVLRTDAAHLTLVAGLVPAGDAGKGAVDHTTPMALAAYQFEQHDGAWKLIGNQGVFALRGFFGEASVRAVPLSGQRHAIGVEYGSCWQGYCGTWLALYELDKGTVRQEPAVEMALSGINVDATSDCVRRLQPLIKTHVQDPGKEDRVPADSHDCYAIESSWAVEPSREQPGDLVIRYQGAMSRAEAPLAPASAVDQRQVLRYNGGKYRAVSGFNPVPPI
jgi:hypothetical protein